MTEQLKHIFDSSACLSKRQLKDYVGGVMNREECHALEHHLNACSFCSEAIEGIMEHDQGLVVTEELSAGFLKDHFSLINPQVHLNSIAPTVAAQPEPRRRVKSRVEPLFKPSAIAAALILGLGILWYLDRSEQTVSQAGPVAQAFPATQASEADVPASSSQSAAGKATEREPLAAVSTGLGTAPISGSEIQSGSNGSREPDAGKDDKQTDPVQAGAAVHPPEDAVKPATQAGQRKDTPGLASGFVAEAQPVPTAPVQDVKERPSATNEPKEMVARESSELAGAASDRSESRKKTKEEADGLISADALFDSGKYGAALAVYKKQMKPGGNRAEQYAALQAARCYLQTGQQARAIDLLQRLEIEAGGSIKRQARKILRDFRRDE